MTASVEQQAPAEKKRVVALVVVMVGIVALLSTPILVVAVGRSSSAAFGDNEQLGVNRVGAATLDIELGKETAVMEISDLAPGGQVLGELDVLNAGTLPLRYELTAEHDGDLLADALRWDVWVAEVCSSSLRATGVDVLAADVAIDELDLGFRSLGVATSERICLRSTLPATTGNTHQGRVLDLTFVASAEHDLAAEQEGATP